MAMIGSVKRLRACCSSTGVAAGAPAATPVLLQQARKRFTLPIIAIGGITLHNAPQLLGAGADYLAVINGLFGAPDADAVKARASSFSQLINAC